MTRWHLESCRKREEVISSTDRLQPHYSMRYSMSLLLTSRAHPWTTSRVLLTRVAHQESKLLIWLRLSAGLVNRDKDLIATTDAHHRPVRVHAQRPGKGLQAKQKVCAPKTRPYKSQIKTEITCLTVCTITLCTKPYSASKMNIRVNRTFDNTMKSTSSKC